MPPGGKAADCDGEVVSVSSRLVRRLVASGPPPRRRSPEAAASRCPRSEKLTSFEWPIHIGRACRRLGRLPVHGHLRAGGIGDKSGAEQLASSPRAGLGSGQNALGCFGGDGGRCADAFTDA